MPKLSLDEAFGFLAEANHLARVATVDRDGMPRVVPLWFIMEGDNLCFTPRSQSVLWLNMLRDSRVGISIDEDEQPYRKVTVQGRVQVLYEPGRDRQWQHLYRAMARRYVSFEAANEYVDATDDQPRPLCAIDLSVRTTRLSTWRMPTTGEDPRGIWHNRYYAPGTKMRSPSPDKSG